MKIKLSPNLEARYLLGLRPPHLEKDSDGQYISAAPYHLSTAIETTALVGLTEGERTALDTAYELNAAPMLSIHCNPTEENRPSMWILKQMFSNRPLYYSDVGKVSPVGDGSLWKDESRCDASQDHVDDFVINKVLMEQDLVTSTPLAVRKGGDNADKADMARRDGEGPMMMGLMPCGPLKLLMKAAVDSIDIVLDTFDAGFRTLSFTPDDNKVGWATQYTVGSDSMWKDEPDCVEESMNNSNMWREDAPLVRPYIKKGLFSTGSVTFPRDSGKRQVDFQHSEGRGDFDRDDVRVVLANDLDSVAPYKAACVAGSVVPFSSDSSVARADDKNTKALISAAALVNIHKSVVTRNLRNFLVSVAIARSIKSVHASNALIALNDRWFGPKTFSLKDLTLLKVALALPLDQFGRMNDYASAGVVFSGSDRQRINFGKTKFTLATSGTVDVTMSYPAGFVTELKTACGVGTGAGAGTGCMQNVVTGLTRFADASRARPIFGRAETAGDWNDQASGRFFDLSCLYSSGAEGLPKGAHNHIDPRGPSMPAQAPSAAGGMIEIETELLGSAYWAAVGAALCYTANPISGYFEGSGKPNDPDDIERDVSSWNDGDDFFVFFFTLTNQGG